MLARLQPVSSRRGSGPAVHGCGSWPPARLASALTGVSGGVRGQSAPAGPHGSTALLSRATTSPGSRTRQREPSTDSAAAVRSARRSASAAVALVVPPDPRLAPAGRAAGGAAGGAGAGGGAGGGRGPRG